MLPLFTFSVVIVGFNMFIYLRLFHVSSLAFIFTSALCSSVFRVMNIMFPISTVRRQGENPCGMDGCSGAVQREYLLPGGLEGCYWRELWRARELHYYIQTENIKPLRVACSKCIHLYCFVSVMMCFNMSSMCKHMKAYCLLFIHLLRNKCFQDG
jgi:hypothetical protein